MIAVRDFDVNKMYNFMQKAGDFFLRQTSINHLSMMEYAKKMCQFGTISYEEDKDVLGMVIGYTSNTVNNLSYITQVFVLPEMRGRGIAGRLLDQYIQYCKDIDLDGIWLTTEHDNDKAIKLYQSRGFKIEEYNHDYLIKLVLMFKGVK